MRRARTRLMDILPVLLSSAMNVILFVSLAAALIKVFQIAADVKELKDGMQELRRNAIPPVTPEPAGPLSPEALVRAVHAQSYDALDANIYPPQS
jgi:hypothetical protein